MDADEFKRLFLPCHQQLYRVAYRLSGNEQDAQDLVQETFLKMWSSRDKLGAIDSPVAFGITTLKHVYV
ncbi:MAG: RNA polymerase sigma factor, partial [Duncaniella sp.]|nr:RNA polymerase sigma factor [Duncaniella sp.]